MEDALSESELRGVFENKKAHLLEAMLNELADGTAKDEDGKEEDGAQLSEMSDSRSSSRARHHSRRDRKRKRTQYDSPESRHSLAEPGSSSSLALDPSSRDGHFPTSTYLSCHDYAPIVLETPEEKMRERDRLADVDEDANIDPFDIVKSTPMAKRAGGTAHKRASKRLSELVRQSEERMRDAERLREEKRRSLLTVELRSSQNLLTPPRRVRHVLFGSSQCSQLSSPSSSQRLLRVRSDLTTRFRECNQQGKSPITSPNGKCSNSPNGKRRLRNGLSPQKLNSVVNGLNGHAHSSPSKLLLKTPEKAQRKTELETYGITWEKLQKYRKRMNAIDTAPVDVNGELVLPWGSQRTSLLEEQKDAVKGRAAVPVQKNRTGRVIRHKGETVYIAHTLLNVNNPDPLADWKKNKRVSNMASPTKLHRLVRPACKASRRKLDKMRIQQVKLSKVESSGDLASEEGSSCSSSSSGSSSSSASSSTRSSELLFGQIGHHDDK